MKSEFIVSVTGPDRPGLIKELAQLTHEHGGIWTSSEVVRLQGQFAGLLSIDIHPEHAKALAREFKLMPFHEVKLAPPRDEVPPTPQAVCLTVVGPDRAGLVNEIAQILVEHHADIDNMSTERLDPTAHAAGQFRARFILHLRAELDQAALCAQLERIEDQLHVELTSAVELSVCDC